MKTLYLYFFLMMAMLSPARADTPLPILTGTVSAIVAGDVIRLDDKTDIKLDNVYIPDDYRALAIDELRKTTLNKNINVYNFRDDEGIDRYGLQNGHVITQDKLWVQQDLINKGLAYADTTPHNNKMVRPLIAAEATARLGKKGLWGNPTYQTKSATALDDKTSGFQVIEGVIVDAAKRKDFIYLNFGDNWKIDFTIEIPKTFWSKFNQPETWQNKKIRMRGWVEQRRGPMITLTHPEQIEFITP